MKKLTVPVVFAVLFTLSQTAAAEVGQWSQHHGLMTPADREQVAEIDHNADGMSADDSDTVAPASDAPVTSVPPAPTTTPPKPIVTSPMVKKNDSATDVPAPHVKAKKIAAARDIPMIETQNPVESSPDVNYVTGGIGDDERSSIESAKGDYNLHVMSASINGAFVGDARVVVSTGGKEMLNVVAGPLLYAKLPAGNYSLEATLGEQKKHQDFTISEKQNSANVHLAWKVDATRSDQ